jgi:hypothetical protein
MTRRILRGENFAKQNNEQNAWLDALGTRAAEFGDPPIAKAKLVRHVSHR